MGGKPPPSFGTLKVGAPNTNRQSPKTKSIFRSLDWIRRRRGLKKWSDRDQYKIKNLYYVYEYDGTKQSIRARVVGRLLVDFLLSPLQNGIQKQQTNISNSLFHIPSKLACSTFLKACCSYGNNFRTIMMLLRWYSSCNESDVRGLY